MKRIALIVGAGPGLSASLARALAKRAHHVVLAARDTSDLRDLASEVGATTIDCDASDRRDMASLFERVDALDGTLEVAVYNASHRVRGPIAELDPVAVEAAISVSEYGAFLMAHHAAKRMLVKNSGALLFTGASAGVKGFAESAPFAMGKFALRGLCQSLARELHPKGIHVGHIVIDGGIADRSSPDAGHADDMLDPGEIAKSYMALIDQHRSAWTSEIEIRPWVERF
ncbi:MAG: SDR family NAD(P)-dependent oxidoreductase [Pseudomonadota bacterium]